MPGSATDPTTLYRLRDGIYAPDLLVVAVAELDLFTRIARAGSGRRRAVRRTPAGRPGRRRDGDQPDLLERDADDRLRVSRLAGEHLVAGSPHDLRAYFASLRERPGCAELLSVLKTGRPEAVRAAVDG